MKWVDWVKAALAAIGGALSWLFGGWDMLIIALVCFVVADYVTGIIAGAINKQLSSAIGFRGILKKVLIFIVIAVAVMLDRLITELIGAGQAVCRTVVCTFYIVNEFLSILENLGRAGVPYPAKLKEVILILNKKEAAMPPLNDGENGTTGKEI